jgi:hypothetical protein
VKYVVINVIGLAAVVAVLALGFVAFRALTGNGGGATMTPDGRFPEFVYTSPESLAAYRLAASNRGFFSRIPCYCGCVDLPRNPHESLDDCFFDPGGSVDPHAAGCDLCQKIAQDAAAWRGEGESAFVVRSRIDAKYRAFGPPTSTPPVSP